MIGINEHTGYDMEAAAFKTQEIEQLRALRERLEAERRASEQATHWMHCPKCGGEMEEAEFENVVADRCTACGGVHFDPHAVEELVRYERDQGTFWRRLFHPAHPVHATQHAHEHTHERTHENTRTRRAA